VCHRDYSSFFFLGVTAAAFDEVVFLEAVGAVGLAADFAVVAFAAGFV
jgi:hypothetical protein